MFDKETAALISSATPLPGLDLDDLPRQLTDAYATLVSARIRLREAPIDWPPSEDVARIVDETSRLAYSYEALVSVLSDRDSRAASAFVAGAAHHVTLMAERIIEHTPRPSRLTHESISPEVSSTILFLIAESSADAAEMAKAIFVETNDVVEASLLRAIIHLANGKLHNILNIVIPRLDQWSAGGSYDQAVRALYILLLRGIRAMASNMLGEKAGIGPENGMDPRFFFERVKELSITPLNDLSEIEVLPHSVYPGPYHLASLLSSAAGNMMGSALVSITPPSGVDEQNWSAVVQSIAGRRPFLWRNHRQAIAAGYLEPGTSAVVSFPTGAGKSTLSELKIAAALLRGVKTIFLAPTLALVDQTARALSESFPGSEVSQERPEEPMFNIESNVLPMISVMTPERCLALLSFSPDIFSGVGLLVFDECHLLHPRKMDNSRRAVDAMLCVLNFVSCAPTADLLFLSAMMMNAEEIAAWLQSLTGRACLPLALTWKPTRQVRGCVVYGEEEINELSSKLRETRKQVPNKNAPAKLKRELLINPFGFFCLHQTWQSTARRDYALLPLLDQKVVLSTGTARDGSWYLTPNGNQVACSIAASTARQGLKTLVFAQTVPLANSASERLCEDLNEPGCELTTEEIQMYAGALDECGGADHLYLEVDDNHRLISPSACHHGLLLPVERHLHESLFRRRDGINVLVATSTLAQGMNLPSEVVIIGGDSRFDPDAEKMERLEAHEMLNAAGRAGRAGDASYGFVIVVPSKVVHFNNKTNTIHNHWTDLQAIFSKSDQCLVIDDPITSLLDEVHAAATPASDMAVYLLRRLPIGNASNPSENDEAAKTLLSRSLAAYRARMRGDLAWIATRIDAVAAMRRADPEVSDVLTWEDRLAASAGLQASIIRELGEPFKGPVNFDAPLSDWYSWMTNWWRTRSHLLPSLIRREALEGLLGSTYRALVDDAQRGKEAADHVFPLLDRWIAGESLVELERSIGTPEHLIGKCENARGFALRVVPELAYIFSLPAQIFRALKLERGDQAEAPLPLELLGSCVREGFDCVEKLALQHVLKGRVSRRQIHRQFEIIKPFLQAPSQNERFVGAIRRVEDAVSTAVLI